MTPLVQEIQIALENAKDPNRVVQMEAYMKNHFIFLGVMSGPRKIIFQQFKPQLQNLSPAQTWDFIHECWVNPYRELQYIGIDLLLASYKKIAQPSDAAHLTFLLTNHTWWDSLDLIASHTVGHFAQKYPVQFKELAQDWEASSNFWLHRTLLIHQLKYKQQTDLALLQYYISQFKWNKEFFIQKAIGWSLREVSKWNPEWVSGLVAAENLAGLAKREALKYVS
ncbi:MAG: DNA alkylation repair protein [Flavobacteriales bacterium]